MEPMDWTFIWYTISGATVIACWLVILTVCVVTENEIRRIASVVEDMQVDLKELLTRIR